jgi:hypothetical protein
MSSNSNSSKRTASKSGTTPTVNYKVGQFGTTANGHAIVAQIALPSDIQIDGVYFDRTSGRIMCLQYAKKVARTNIELADLS